MLLALTVPVVDFDEEDHNWNKWLNVFHVVSGPVFIALITKRQLIVFYTLSENWHDLCICHADISKFFHSLAVCELEITSYILTSTTSLQTPLRLFFTLKL